MASKSLMLVSDQRGVVILVTYSMGVAMSQVWPMFSIVDLDLDLGGPSTAPLLSICYQQPPT